MENSADYFILAAPLGKNNMCVVNEDLRVWKKKIELYIITVLAEGELRKKSHKKKKKRKMGFLRMRVNFRIFSVFQIQDNQILFNFNSFAA